MKKRYSYRAYPTPGQERALARLFGSVRGVFNDAVAAQRATYEATEKTASLGQLSAALSAAKKTPERSWLADVSSVPLQQSIRQADKALRAFFDSVSGRRKGRRVNPPRFKSRKSRQSAEFTKSGFSRLRETTHGVGFVRLAKIGDVRFALSRELPSEPSSVTITKDAAGRYFVSFVVEVQTSPALPEIQGRIAALDLGLTDYAAIAYSDGSREKVPNPRHLKAAKRRLTRAQKALSRKTKGSARRERARIKVAREHARVADTRRDFQHKLTTRLVRENQAVVVEKLSVLGLARSGPKNAQGRGIRRSWADAGFGQFLALLEGKAEEHERDFVAVDPFWTSQTCSVCGVHDGPKPLAVREWQCGSCGAMLDRDYNAAVNILLASGLEESLNGRGENVRLRLAEADLGEASTHRTDLALAGQAA